MSEELEDNIDDINLDDFNFDDLIEEAGLSEDNSTQEDLQEALSDDVINLGDGFDNEIAEIEDLNLTSVDNVIIENENERIEPFFEASFDEDMNSSESDAFSELENNVVEDINDEPSVGAVFAEDDVVIDENEAPISQEEVVVDDNIYSEDVAVDKDADDFVVDEKIEVATGDIEPSVDEVELPDGFFQEEVIETELPREEFSADEINDSVHNEYFNDDVEEEFIVSSGVEAVEDVSNMSVLTSQNVGQLRWYSGSSDDSMFEISKGFESGTFNANEECKTIHVNVGYDTYGWEVQFSDGLVMNLRDVREYQIRNGRLPNSDGRIVFAQSALMFSGVERIVVYENIKYFSYGI